MKTDHPEPLSLPPESRPPAEDGKGVPSLSLSSQADAMTTVLPPLLPDGPAEGRYVLKAFHARGGMGEVWLAQDLSIGREVALKKLAAPADPSRGRFLAEAQITGQLEHPAIVPVHDLSIGEDGRPFYIMKFVRGRTLKDAIAEHHAACKAGSARQTQRVAFLQVFVDLCHAAAYAHSRGVIHRDIKPANVMLGAYGETLLLDWGLAKVLGETESPGGFSGVHPSSSEFFEPTLAGSVMGSLPYMAPEMAEGRNAEIDARTDVYLLGATLYEMLTGQPPRQGDSREELLEMAQNCPPAPPRRLAPDVPRALDAVCLKAMAHRKADRYPGAMELAEDVQRYMAGEAVSAWREPLLMRLARWSRRHRRALTRCAIALLVVLIGVAGGLKIRQLERRHQEAIQLADRFRERQEAREQIARVLRLVDETRYYAASTDPAGEHAPYYDPRRATDTAAAALSLAGGWGPALERLPVPEERAVLARELHDLLMMMAQLSIDGPAASGGREEARSLLDQAAALGAEDGSSSHERLREKLDGPGMRSQAFAPRTALDHFLLGEQARMNVPGNRDDAASRAKPLAEAIGHYRDAIGEDPRHYWSHFQLGRCLLAQGRSTEAVEPLSTCVGLRPDSPWGYSARGLVLGLLRRFEEAHRDLHHALALAPDFRPAQLNRGVVHWLEGREDDALRDFNAVDCPPDERRLVEAAFYRGQVFLKQRETKRAIEDLDRVVAERPDFRPARLLRCQAHLAAREEDLALRDLDVLLGTGDGSAEARADLCARRGRLLREMAAQAHSWMQPDVLRLAAAQLEQAVLGKAPSAATWADLGAVQELLGQPAALRSYTRSLELRDSSDVRVMRAWLLQKVGREEEARKDFHVAVGRQPEDAHGHAGLGYLHSRLGSPIQAHCQGAWALARGSDDYLALHNIACIYAELSRGDIEHQDELQQLAVAILGRAVVLWRKGGAGPDEIELIKHDPALSILLQRQDIKDIIGD